MKRAGVETISSDELERFLTTGNIKYYENLSDDDFAADYYVIESKNRTETHKILVKNGKTLTDTANNST